MSKIDFTILTCTFNGSERLPATLRHLSQLNCRGLEVELILVDNASTDETPNVAASVWQELLQPFPINILHEPIPGKSHALSLGLTSARGKYIVICDDDNWLQSDYLLVANSLMEANPRYGILGGRAEAVADVTIPEWFYEIQYAYACGALSSVSADFTGKAFIWGAGMVIRADVARKIIHENFPLMLTGRRNSLLTAGEDDEKCVRTWLLGYKTYFNSNLVLFHYMPASRLQLEYRDQLLSGFKEQGVIINAYRRLYNIIYSNEVSKSVWRQFFAYLIGTVTSNADMKRISRDYLFFLTKSKMWETKVNKQILSYYKFMTNAEANSSRPLPNL